MITSFSAHDEQLAQISHPLDRASTLSKAGKDRHALKVIYDLFGDLILREQFSQTDALLASVDLSQLDSSCVLGLLSSTFIGRERLEQWLPLRARVEEHFRSVRMPADKIDRLLRGMK